MGTPQIDGFEIAGFWEPAPTVGGDYFDVLRLSEKKLGTCIADVVGKGVPAALFHGDCAGDGKGLRVRVGLTGMALPPGQLCRLRQYR